MESHVEGKRRNVYGRDIIVTYSGNGDTVGVNHIHSYQGENGRFTPDSLLETLGLKPEDATMQFLKNNNLHQSGKAQRGAVLLVNLCIGMIVKSVGSYILFHILYPLRKSGYKIIDLRIRDRYYGFFLQQIRGPRIGPLSTRRHETRTGLANYPFCIDGHVYMDPLGPDFCEPVSLQTVSLQNEAIAQEFLALKENMCSRSEKKNLKEVKLLRKSRKANVLYVVESDRRVNMVVVADLFYVPYGSPRDHVQCPWKRTDGSTHGV